jgi:hypothetical protein
MKPAEVSLANLGHPSKSLQIKGLRAFCNTTGIVLHPPPRGERVRAGSHIYAGFLNFPADGEKWAFLLSVPGEILGGYF